jgi:hypothetical protein
MKHVIKYKFNAQEGFLSVVEKSNHYYALVHKDAPKVIDIMNTHKLNISYELKVPNYQEVTVHVLHDHALTSWVFNKLEEEKNLYFKVLDAHLCVLEIEKEKS